jgi:hypothetical protein
MIELLGLLLATVGSLFRSRKRLILEKLLLRQQLQVALRHQRRPRLRTRDKLFWLLIRASIGTGDAISSLSGRRLCCAGIARAGGCSGTGSRIIRLGGRD